MIEKLSNELKKLIKIVYRFVAWGNEVNCSSEPLGEELSFRAVGEESQVRFVRDISLSLNMISVRTPIRNMSMLFILYWNLCNPKSRTKYYFFTGLLR